MPFAIPDEEPIVATDVLPLNHVPPPDASFNADVAPTHILVLPVMAATDAFTVIPNVVKHPELNV